VKHFFEILSEGAGISADILGHGSHRILALFAVLCATGIKSALFALEKRYFVSVCLGSLTLGGLFVCLIVLTPLVASPWIGGRMLELFAAIFSIGGLFFLFAIPGVRHFVPCGQTNLVRCNVAVG
jgi:hypothetical protein